MELRKQWIGITEAAEMLGVTNRTVKRIPASQLPYLRVNERGDRKYRPGDIETYIAARMVSD